MKNKFSKNLIRTTSISMAVCLSLSVPGCGAMSQSDDQNASVSTSEVSETADIENAGVDAFDTATVSDTAENTVEGKEEQVDDSKAIELKTVDTDGNSYKDSRVYVQKIDGLSDDFMRGVDISSYLSEEESGVVFKDYDGNDIDSQGFFDLLSDSGVNYIRIRVIL